MQSKSLTKADKRRFEQLQEMGCCVCLIHYGEFRPCDIHHIDGKTKPGAHQKTIGLCNPGHHMNGSDKLPFISRHPYKARFEAAYGTELELLIQVEDLLK